MFVEAAGGEVGATSRVQVGAAGEFEADLVGRRFRVGLQARLVAQHTVMSHDEVRPVDGVDRDHLLRLTGEEGLESVRKESPDLIILDLRLPKKTGFEVCASLKSSKDTSHIPIVMVSASAEVDARLLHVPASVRDLPS